MSNPLPNWFRQTQSKWIAVILFLLALGVRLIGIDWALPSYDHLYSLHPDEPVVMAYADQLSAGKGQLDPGFYNYGTLYLTLLSVARDVTDVYSGGAIDGDEDHEAEAAKAGRIHVAGRWISALSGAGIALLVFLSLVGRVPLLGAFLAGLSIAFGPALVVHSRFQTVDMFAAFLLSASLFYTLKFSEPRDEPPRPIQLWRWTIWAGVFAGLSAGTKYNGLLVLVAFFIASYDRAATSLWLQRCLLAFVMAVLAFFIATPGALMNTAKFAQDFSYEVRHASTGHGLVFAGMGTGFGVHFANLLIGWGIIALPVALFGFFGMLAKRELGGIAVGAFTFLFFVLIGSAEILFCRYTFPLYFGLAYGFGYAFHVAKDHAIGKHTVAVLGLLGVGTLAYTTSIWTGYMTSRDPRMLARDYFRKAMPNDVEETCGLVSDPWFYSPALYSEVAAPRWVPFEIRWTHMRHSRRPRLVQYVPENPDERFQWDVRLLIEHKPAYVAYSSFETEGYERLARQNPTNPEHKLFADRYTSFMDELKRSYEIVFFNPDSLSAVHDLAYIRPNIWIWKRKATP